MATTSETIYTHTCDLCCEVKDKTELRELHSQSTDSTSMVYRPAKDRAVDVCPDCRDKPISAVFALFDSGE